MNNMMKSYSKYKVISFILILMLCITLIPTTTVEACDTTSTKGSATLIKKDEDTKKY